MADAQINHRFVSAIADDPDITLIRPSNWNDTLIVTQGNEGEVFVRRGASDSGAAWEGVSTLAGDVYGPASAVDNQLVLFDGITGKDIKAATGTGFVKSTSGVVSNVTSIVETDLSLSDNTTANSSTSKHGLLPKLDNNTSHFLNGQGGWTTPVVTETDLAFTDITTADSSTAKHGLLPKLDNISTHFLSGQGSWLTPSPQITEANLSFTDITTANSDTTKHGLFPKLSNNSSQFIDGVGNWTGTHPGGYYAAKPTATSVTGDIEVTNSETGIVTHDVNFTSFEKALVTVSGTWSYVGGTSVGTTLRLEVGSVGGTILNYTIVNNTTNASTFSFSFQYLYTAGSTSTITFVLSGQNSAAVTTHVFNAVISVIQFLNK